MNGTLKNIVIFVGGAAAGAVATWFFAKRKFEAEAEQKIEDVTQQLNQRYENHAAKDIAPSVLEKSSIADYVKRMEERTQTQYSKYISNPTETNNASRVFGGTGETPEALDREVNEYLKNMTTEKNEYDPSATYVVGPAYFGMEEDYDYAEWMLFTDGVVANNDYEVIDPEEVERHIGAISLDSEWGKYEEDTIFLQNDAFKMYYEITKDYRDYSQLKAQGYLRRFGIGDSED